MKKRGEVVGHNNSWGILWILLIGVGLKIWDLLVQNSHDCIKGEMVFRLGKDWTEL